jgi:hypothetical protein
MTNRVLNNLAAHFKRLTALIRPVIREPTFDSIGAMVIMLAALGWELIKVLVIHPDIFIFAPFAAIGLLLVLAALFGIGAVGWLIVQLVAVFVRWRVGEEAPSTRAWPAVVLGIAGLFFLGIPEVAEKLAWWQENLFRYLPQEPETLKACHKLIHSQRQFIYGLMILAASGCLVFWPVFRRFREKLRDALTLFKNLTNRRNWVVPAVLAVLIPATIAFIGYRPLDPVFTVLFIELAALVLWLFAPLIRAYFFFILVAIAWCVPALIVDERTGTKGLLWYVLFALFWGGWLVSSTFLRALWWRIVFWAGTLVFVGYIAFGPGAV